MGGSTIDIRGGAGSVDTVLVQSNTLQNSAGMQNVITEDADTTNATILNPGANVLEVNDGGSPLISSGVANSNTDPTVTLTGTAPAGSMVTVSDGGSTHPTPPNAPDVTLPQAAIDHMSDKAVLHVPFLPGSSLAEVAKPLTALPGAAVDHASDHTQPIELFAWHIASFPPSASVAETPVQDPPPGSLGQLLAHCKQ